MLYFSRRELQSIRRILKRSALIEAVSGGYCETPSATLVAKIDAELNRKKEPLRPFRLIDGEDENISFDVGA